jgi:hypothetical protein
MCVPASIAAPVWFFGALLCMALWSVYIARRAKRACLDPERYENFLQVFMSWKSLQQPFWYPVDEQDAPIIMPYRKIQFIGYPIIFYTVIALAKCFTPTCVL